MVVPNSTSKDEESTTKKITLKILIPGVVAGSIIGKGGESIKELKSKTNAVVRVSNRDEIFPFTDERIVLVVAPPETVMEAVTFIHSKLRTSLSGDKGRTSKRLKEMKLIVADTSAGKIIGKKGETVKKIQEENKVKVMLTSKGDWGVVPGERVATISGEEDNVNRAIEEMLAVVAKDPHARLEKSLVYPQYPMFDNFLYHGPPESLYRGPPSPRKNVGPPPRCGRGGFDITPRYDGYQSEQPFPRRGRAPPPFY